jgi:hypothetical protein
VFYLSIRLLSLVGIILKYCYCTFKQRYELRVTVNAAEENGAEENAYRRLVGKIGGEEPLTRARFNGRIILKWIIGNYGDWAWSRFV